MNRLVALHYTTPPDVGGCEVVAAEMAIAASRHPGWSAALVTGSRDVDKDARLSCVATISIPEIGTRHSISQAVFHAFRAGRYPVQLEELSSAIVEKLNALLQAGDLLLSINAFSVPYNVALTQALASLAESRRDVRHATWCFDLAVCMPEYDWSRRHEHPWNLFWRRHPNIAYLVCSQPMARFLATALGADESSFRPLPAGIDPLHALRATDEIARIYVLRSLHEKFPLIFVPAKMSARKALPRAVEVIQHVRGRWPAALVVCAGAPPPHDEATGTYRRSLAELIRGLDLEDAVTVLSWHRHSPNVSFQDTLSMMALSDAVLLTSSRETFVIPILEAALTRVPIFVPATTEVQSWAASYATLYGTQLGPQDIAELICARLAEATAKGYDRVRREFTWPGVFSRMLSVLKDGSER